MQELKPVKNAERIEFKEKFIEKYSGLTDWDPFKKYCLSFLRKSIRINTLKISISDLKKRLSDRFILTPIPWCNEGFWIVHREGRLDIGNTIEHMLGYYYIQESASMIPPIVLDPQPGDIVLDLCAAPGSKTSQLAQFMKNKGVLLANDVKGSRLAALGINLQRCGVSNVIITHCHGERFPQTIMFDKILVDAPCSGTGTIRKSLKTIQTWNPGVAQRLAGTQKKLLARAWTLLKPGGVLVYSTCSLEPEENESIIDWHLTEQEDVLIQPLKIKIKHETPVAEYDGKTYHKEVSKALRLWPQDNDTEGFFICKMKKTIKNI